MCVLEAICCCTFYIMSKAFPITPPRNYNAQQRRSNPATTNQVFPATPPPSYSAHQRKNNPNASIHLNNSDLFYDIHFSKRAALILSYIQLCLSVALIISDIIGIKYPFNWYIYGSPGMLCGIISSISGSFGIWASNHSSRCTIVAHMVFAIISAFICIPFIIYSILIINHIATQNKTSELSTWHMNKHSNLVDYNQWERDEDEKERYFGGKILKEKYNEAKEYGFDKKMVDDDKEQINMKMTIGIFIAQATVGLIQAGVAIASGALTCSVICCRDKPPLSINPISTPLSINQIVLSGPVILISTTQILASILAIILNAVGMLYSYGDKYAYIGSGMWTAIPFILCGIFGILSKTNPSKILIITYMIFAILSIFFFVPYFGTSLVGMSTSANPKEPGPPKPVPISKEKCHKGFGEKDCKWEWTFVHKGLWKDVYDEQEKQRYDDWKKKDTERKVTFGVFLLHTLISLLQIIISVNSAAMACQPICCPPDTVRAQPPIQEIFPKSQIRIQNADFTPREMPASSISSQIPFPYKTPQNLVYLSSTHAEIGSGMKIQSSAHCPDIY